MIARLLAWWRMVSGQFRHDSNLIRWRTTPVILEEIILEHLANGCTRCQQLFGHIYSKDTNT